MFRDMSSDINEYVTKKSWYWYLPAWIFGVYIFTSLLKFKLDGQYPFVIAVPFSFDFFLHEMAHILTAFLPAVMVASAGSLSEMLLGTLLIVGAFKTRCYFASFYCALWFMLAFQSAGQYMADARSQLLPLVSLSGELSGSDQVTHDWNFVFGRLHLLQFDKIIGNSIRAVGIAVGFAGLIFSAWLMYKMADASGRRVLSKSEAQLLAASTAAAGAKPAPVSQYAAINEGSLYPTPTKGRLAAPPATQKSKKV